MVEILTPSSSTSPVVPVVSPQKELRPVVATPVTPQNENRSFVTSPTSTSVLSAPNNISCNAPNNNNNLTVNGNGSEGVNVVSPQRGVVRERRQRSDERNGGSSRRRSGRNNRNAGGAPQSQPTQTNAAVNSHGNKMDLPPGYGEFAVLHCINSVSTDPLLAFLLNNRVWFY